jgi:hypothetical protein
MIRIIIPSAGASLSPFCGTISAPCVGCARNASQASAPKPLCQASALNGTEPPTMNYQPFYLDKTGPPLTPFTFRVYSFLPTSFMASMRLFHV